MNQNDNIYTTVHLNSTIIYVVEKILKVIQLRLEEIFKEINIAPGSRSN